MSIFIMKNTSRTEIIISMLEAARHGGRKTKIVYSSYLSSHQLRPYLELAIGNGLIEYDSTKERYRTTERGLRLLDLYSSLSGPELAPYVRTPIQK
jgi:predicted transcriptional regulator